MLPGGTDPLYRSVLAAAHQRYLRVEVWDNTQRLDTAVFVDGILTGPAFGIPEGGLALLQGSGVTAALGAPVARNMNLVVPMDVGLDDDLLAPYGNEIRAWHGVALGDGSPLYTWQAFAGKIQEDTENPDSGTRMVICSDYGQDVIDNQFTAPRNSDAGIPLEQEFELVVRDGFPNASFGDHDLPAQPTPPLAWEFDRGSALDEMLTSTGSIWWALADGRFVARRYPWTRPGSPVITLTDREGGVILSAGRRRSRHGLYNVITVTGERLNGDMPVYATVSDTNPASPTFAGGKFGVKSRVLRRQTPSTQGGALSAARAALQVSISPVQEWTWQQVPDASVELGDIDGLDLADGRTAIQVITSFVLPFDAHSAMSVHGRSQVVSLVQSGEVN